MVGKKNIANGDSSIKSRMSLIERDLSETSGFDTIRDLIAEGQSPKCFWATAPTGKPHIAYFVPLLKLADFAKAGVDVTILFCDLYAFLVNYKHSLEVVAARTAYYKHLVRAVLHTLGVPDTKVHFVDGSSYELNKEFSLDNYKLSVLITDQDIRATADEYAEAARMSVLMCPNLPCLAEEYLDADFQFGGEDQRGLFAFNERVLPLLGYRKRAHAMNPMVPGIAGPKMSSSVPDSKIEFLDDAETVRQKIWNAPCADGKVEGNGLLSLLRLVVLPIHRNRVESSALGEGAVAGLFRVRLDQSLGGEENRYSSYEEVERDFEKGKITSTALKQALADSVCDIIAPLRKLYEGNEEWKAVERIAYSE